MKYRVLTGALLLSLTVVPWAQAGDKIARVLGNGVETKNVGPTIPSAVVEKKVTKLTEAVHWCSSLEEAKQTAQKQNKPIFWLHALGDLDGVC